MKTQFPTSVDGKQPATYASEEAAEAKPNQQDSLPELPEDGGESPEAARVRQFKSQEYELKQKTPSEGQNSEPGVQ